MSCKRVSVSYRLDKNIADRLDEFVEEHGGSKTSLVEQALTQYMDACELEESQVMLKECVSIMGSKATSNMLSQLLAQGDKLAFLEELLAGAETQCKLSNIGAGTVSTYDSVCSLEEAQELLEHVMQAQNELE